MTDSAVDPQPTAESYFPMGWLSNPFRRQPYPDETYHGAIHAARVTLWNMINWPEPVKDGTIAALSNGAELAHGKLVSMHTEFYEEHPDYPGRSKVLVKEFNDMWRGEITVLLAMFKKIES